MATTKVITRFAPSPTGMLHIGSARTALFCYLFAKHYGGQFLLRIEDTDKERNTEANRQAIIDGLQWLGVPWDGEIYSQSAHEARHREVALELVKRGAAYYDYTTAEELAEARKTAEAKGEFFRFHRDMARTEPRDGVKPSIRIKAPTQGAVTVHDGVQGDVRFPAEELDDLIILRGDGTPTYNLAVVVDDHDMGVTHIIRGDDHLNNAGRQMVIYQAMGWDVPIWAHIPLIHGAEGGKLSKRKGAAGVNEYAAMGYLPEAMRNYLVRLGWSHGDDEIFSDQQAVEWFSNLGDIGKAPARLDFAKLNHVNAHYLRAKSGTELEKLTGFYSPSIDCAKALDSVKAKVSTIPELKEAAQFYFERQPYDDKARATIEKGKANLPLILTTLENLPHWDAHAIKQTLNDTAAAHSKKIGELLPFIRAALVGSMSGPDIPEAMVILGKEECIQRLNRAQKAAQLAFPPSLD